MSRRKIRTFLTCVVAVGVIAVSASCSQAESSSKKIVTSFYPLEFVAHHIVGNDFDVDNVTPLGAEPHDLELTPQTTQEILDAKLVIIMGDGFQPGIEKTAQSREGKTLKVLPSVLENSSKGVDPHIWLDPILFKKVVKEIARNVIALNADKKEIYQQRADELITKLDVLDREFTAAFSQCRTKTFITSHDAFSRLAQRYGLIQESIAGISPENEPSPERIATLSKLAREKNISVIFTEELVSEKVAQSLSNDAGLETQILSPLEGLTQAQHKNDVDYFDLMRDNLARLTAALECAPA